MRAPMDGLLRWRRSGAALVALPSFALAILLLGSPAARAQDSSLSGSLTDPLSSSLSPQSEQSGLSSSLLPEGTNLLAPSAKSGISDPLGFLIETSTMSPYPAGFGFADSYAETQAQTQGLNDPTLALRFNEYRSNRALMSGAAAASMPGARTAGAGGTVSGLARRRMDGAGSTSTETALAPFSAGSSALAARTGAQSGFLDPNAALAALRNTPGGSPNAQLGGDASGSSGSTDAAAAGLSTSAPVGFSSADADLAAGSGVIPTNYTGAATASATTPLTMGLIEDHGADAMPLGNAPGRIQPQFSISTSAPNGLPDSTLGTAGNTAQELQPGLSPLLWAAAGAADSSSTDFGGQSLSFLHPSLRPHAGLHLEPRTPVSLEDIGRKMRRQAMAKNPNITLPSAFARSTMIRDYKRQQESGRRQRKPSRYARGIGDTRDQQEQH